MKISESKLKQIVKEETDRVLQEMDWTPGLIYVGAILTLKFFTWLIAYHNDKENLIQSDKHLKQLDLYTAQKFASHPNIIKMLKKFASPGDKDNQEILLSIENGDIDNAVEIIKKSNKLSETEINELEKIVNYIYDEKADSIKDIEEKYPRNTRGKVDFTEL